MDFAWNYGSLNNGYKEPQEGEYLLDMSGFIDLKDEIALFAQAGETLDAVRREMFNYDNDDESDDELLDNESPLRTQGLDPVDLDGIATNIVNQVNKSTSESSSVTGSDGGQSESGSVVDPVDPVGNVESNQPSKSVGKTTDSKGTGV